MSFLSDIGGIASAVTGNPVFGAIGGLFGDDEVRESPSAIESMPPEYRALMTRTANQITSDLNNLTRGDENTLKQYQSYFSNYSKQITADDLRNFGSRPTFGKADSAYLGLMQRINSRGNKYYVQALDDIEALKDDFDVEMKAGKIPSYKREDVLAWMKGKLGDKWTDAHSQIEYDLYNAAGNSEGKETGYGERGYFPGEITKSLKKVTEARRYDEADAMLKSAIGIGIADVPKLMTNYIKSTQDMLKYNTGLTDDEIAKMSVADLDSTITKLQKGEITAQPNIERIRADNKTAIDNAVSKALAEAGMSGSQVNTAKLKELGVVNYDAGDMPTKEMAANGFWAIYKGEPVKYHPQGGFIYLKDAPTLANNPTYIAIKQAASNPEAAKIAAEAERIALGKFVETLANPNSVNDFIKNSQLKTQELKTKYDTYLTKVKETAGGMPEYMAPTDVSHFPGDLTTKPSEDELSIQADIREELANSKTYNDYAKMVEDVKFAEMNKQSEALKALALSMGKSQAEVSQASVDQLYIWAKNGTTPEAKQWMANFEQSVEAGIAPILREMPADIKAGYLSMQEIEKAMKTSATGLTDLIEDFKKGRNPTENEEKYRSMLMDMAQNGLGVDLSSDIYNFATSDLKAEATQRGKERQAKMAAMGLGNSSAAIDQQRIVDEELQRELGKIGVDSKVEATKLNQSAKEYGITTGTDLENTLANRYLKGTQLAADATTGLADEMIDRTKDVAGIQAGLQQVGEIRRDANRASLLGLADKQEARTRENQKNIYDEFIRRLNYRENKIGQGVNAVSGTGVQVMDAENSNKQTQYKIQTEADKAKNDALSTVFANIYTKKNKPKTKTVDADDDFFVEFDDDYDY